MKWWSVMDLTAWCTDGRVLASVTRDMPFAQAIAAERCKRRGRRQRITVGRPDWWHEPLLFVDDAPEPVAEPCS